MKTLFAVVLSIALTACTRPGASAKPIVLSGPTMGTAFRVTVVPHADLPDAAALRDAVAGTLARVNAAMSTYVPDSEVSRFNRSRGTDWFPVSAETRTVVGEALALSAATNGAFDITVGPLVDAWRFGAGDGATAENAVPDEATIRAILGRVGYGRLETRADPPALRKRDPAVEIDLSAIAKGYAVDAVAEALAALGAARYFIDVGGEVRVRGERPGGGPWRVGIEAPRIDRREVHRVLRLAADHAMATSGDYRNFREIDGVRYGHTIDPTTGRPVRAAPPALRSATVLDPSCMRADALATGLMVMGFDRAKAFAAARGLAVYLIAEQADGRLVEHDSAPLAPRIR